MKDVSGAKSHGSRRIVSHPFGKSSIPDPGDASSSNEEIASTSAKEDQLRSESDVLKVILERFEKSENARQKSHEDLMSSFKKHSHDSFG